MQPYFRSGKITKDEYKDVMRKAVPAVRYLWLYLCNALQYKHCWTTARIIYTGWPIKTVHFMRYHVFCSYNIVKVLMVIYRQYLGPWFCENIRYSFQNNCKRAASPMTLHAHATASEDKALIKVLRVEKGWNVDCVIWEFPPRQWETNVVWFSMKNW